MPWNITQVKYAVFPVTINPSVPGESLIVILVFTSDQNPVTITDDSAGNGSLTAVAVAPGDAGSGYVVGDQLTVSGSPNATISVTSVGAGGAVTGVSLVNGGGGFSAGINFYLTSGGSGSSCAIDGSTGNVYTSANCDAANYFKLQDVGDIGTSQILYCLNPNVGTSKIQPIANANGSMVVYKVTGLMAFDVSAGASFQPQVPGGILYADTDPKFTVTSQGSGTGYVVNDVCNVTGGGGTGAQVKVTQILAGGAVTGISLTASGSNYLSGRHIATSGGTGTGLQLRIGCATTTAPASPAIQTSAPGEFIVANIILVATLLSQTAGWTLDGTSLQQLAPAHFSSPNAPVGSYQYGQGYDFSNSYLANIAAFTAVPNPVTAIIVDDFDFHAGPDYEVD